MNSLEISHPIRSFNGHTDGSAPIVQGFVQESTGLPKDLSTTISDPTITILDLENGEQKHQMDQWDLKRAEAAGEKLVNLAAFLNGINKKDGSNTFPQRLLESYMVHHNLYNDLLNRGEGRIQEVKSGTDLDQVMSGNQIGLVRSVEGVYGEHTREDLDIMVDKGVKIWCFMWNFNNPDTGATAKTTNTDEDTGLTIRGQDFIDYLANKKRVAIDLSHASDMTTRDVLKITKAGTPAIATHSGARAVTDDKRNLTDELAWQIATQGGFIGIPFVNGFIDNSPEGAVAHIRHFADIGLINHISLGPDFDGVTKKGVVKGLEDPTVAYNNISEAMEKNGFTQKEIEGVLFKNALRYMQNHLFTNK